MRKYMRRNIFLALILCGLLTGCQGRGHTEATDYAERLTKAQEIAVTPAGATEAAEVFSGEEEQKKFLEELGIEEGIEDWAPVSLPEDAKETGSFVFAQEETLRFGETETDGELYDICRLRVYDGPYVSLELGKVTVTFEVPEETADKLNSYF